jgi:tetratricopeptide (TPR) repeat protein
MSQGKKRERSESQSSAEEEVRLFVNDEQAEKARKEGADLEREGKLEEAADVQSSVVAYYAKKYGDFHVKTAAAYLEYGQTLLSLIQCADPEQAALSALTSDNDEELQACFEVLECARLGFEKAETANPSDESVKSSLISVHLALGNFYEETDREDDAIKEYEFMVALNQDRAQPKARDAVSALFSIGSCHLRNNRCDDAVKYLDQAIDAAKKSDIPKELVDEMKSRRQEAIDLKKQGGEKFVEGLKQEIRSHFPDEESIITDPQETLESAQRGNAFVQPLPPQLRSDRTLSRSVPAGLTVSIPARESSGSISFIQPMGDRSEAGRPVNHNVVVRKKPKSEENSMSIQTALKELSQTEGKGSISAGGAPSPKKPRLE